MEKINVAELLKNCPSGIELDSPMYDSLYFDRVEEDYRLPISCYTIYHGNKTAVYFTEFGSYNTHKTAKCVIFPKGKTTWEGFVPPCQFKDWDILATDLGSVFYLNTRFNTSEYYGCYVGIGGDGSFHICEPFAYKECCRFATKEERTRLFDAIKENGYEWNEKTKTLKKLVEPKFKVGDWVVNKFGDVWHIDSFNSEIYQVSNGDKYCYFLIEEQDKMHLWTIQDAKDGDVLVDKDNNIGIFQKFEGIYWYSYIYLGCDGKLRGFSIGGSHKQTDVHPATKEQRNFLFQKIKEAGYCWNDKTKTLEKLFPYNIGTKVWVKSDKEHEYIHTIVGISRNACGNLEYEVKEEKTGIVVHYPKELLIPITKEPTFKVGDRVRGKYTNNIYTIARITPEGYELTNGQLFTFGAEDCHELVPDKFDINTLIPFESKVLVRHNKDNKWTGSFFSFIDRDLHSHRYKFVTTANKSYPMMIPYKGNEYLLGKVEDCNDFYKIW